jgi:hypothetical protein
MTHEAAELAGWRHSSYCNGGACVQVTQLADLIAMRDSGHPDRIVVPCSPIAWQNFVQRIRTDRLDIHETPSR